MSYKKGFLTLILSSMAIVQLSAMNTGLNSQKKEIKNRQELSHEPSGQSSNDSLANIIEKYAMRHISAEGSELLKKFDHQVSRGKQEGSVRIRNKSMHESDSTMGHRFSSELLKNLEHQVSKDKQEAQSLDYLKHRKNNIRRKISKPLQNAEVRRRLDFSNFTTNEDNTKKTEKIDTNCMVTIKYRNMELSQAFVSEKLGQLNKLLQPKVDQKSNNFNEHKYNAFVSLFNFINGIKNQESNYKYTGDYAKELYEAGILTNEYRLTADVLAVILSKYSLRNGKLLIQNPIKG